MASKIARKENDSPNTTRRPVKGGPSVVTLNVNKSAAIFERKSGTIVPPANKSVLTVRQSVHDVSYEPQECHPSPANFEEYIPWASDRLFIGRTVNVVPVTKEESIDRLSKLKKQYKSKVGQSIIEPTLPSVPQEKEEELKDSQEIEKVTNVVNIETYYMNDILVHIKFNKNKEIPQKLIKLIGLIVDFYPSLSRIIINQGLTSIIIYEISNLLSISNITELVLDNCVVKELNFHVLLERPNQLKFLSLGGCNIGDRGLELICQQLIYPLPASNTLCMLYIPSNKITDVGAGYLAEVLRANRRLRYLNLAGNRLTDSGVIKILSTLQQFPMTEDENSASNLRHMQFLREKQKLVETFYENMKKADQDKKGFLLGKKRMRAIPEKNDIKKNTTFAKKLEIDEQDVDSYFLEKANILAEEKLGEFKDPFNDKNKVLSEDVLYSAGNLHLSYLNISYNSCTLLTINKVIEVLEYQSKVIGGLINICLEGNPMPITCSEYNVLNSLLEKCMGTRNSRISQTQRRRKIGLS